MPAACLVSALQYLRQQPGVQEAVILSTCNRTECYVIARSAAVGVAAIDEFLRKANQMHGDNVQCDLTLLRDDASIHLFRVASGLDSLVFGETQILGQVRKALSAAQNAGTAGPILNRLFMSAIECAREVQTATGIKRKPTSVAAIAADLARAHPLCTAKRKILVIGAGEVGRQCIDELLRSSAGDLELTVLNRTLDNVSAIKNVLPASIRFQATTDFGRLPELCQLHNVIMLATSAEEFLLVPQFFKTGETKLVLDLSVPRNADPAVGSLPGIQLITMDNLQDFVAINVQEREVMLRNAEPVILNAVERFNAFTLSTQAAPTIKVLHEQLEAMWRKSLEQTKGKLSAEAQVQVERRTLSLLKRILHNPSTQLRRSPELADLCFQLFGLATEENLPISTEAPTA